MAIWNMSKSPRVVLVSKNAEYNPDNKDENRCSAIVTQTSPLLATCHESRKLALEGRQLSFSHQLAHSIYFDPALDILSFVDLNAVATFFAATRYSDCELRRAFPDIMQCPENTQNVFIHHKPESLPSLLLLRTHLTKSAHVFASIRQITIIGCHAVTWKFIYMNLFKRQQDYPKSNRVKNRAILSNHQLINGELVHNPGREAPAIHFWSEEEWQERLQKDFL